ncbi:hypothetical protein CDQ84_03210 [Clostridium thermosuccinogenes]|uniref:Oligosaccharide repeat unit polymerase n=1 Tax=Clostridium thermosuccinogenes TaxID=84032 RepID=A0A2K2FJZ1_9CLOT|nr:hypothetical protein [Pseudoclostridium thermosuccinogenes]AUS95179.1 hypothetical protein CDO33_01170 [Pseudoclostridium thermosuccinogenes]PNT99101.1 hypothetical protein CDQ85_03210 [Pseudoclostridium thermosuccinogenes]PNU00905.1 hypothetical protein CDQ84_03210 [Pseudoclostridium thermosuccinogenes]
MELLFWFTAFICFSQGIYRIIFRKDYFNIYTYLLIGINLPLLMYFLKWSTLIEDGIAPVFYFIFIILNMLVILANLVDRRTINEKVIIIKAKKNKGVLLAINIVYFGLTCLENYLGSGYIFPALHNVDIHTYSAPFISYFTNSLFVVLLANFLYWYTTKKRIYLFGIVFFILLLMIGKSSRMIVLISFIQLMSFAFFLYINDKKLGRYVRKKFFKNKKQKYVFVIFGILLILFMVKYTDYRMSHYGKYDINYADTIGYSGPETFKNVISVYYGYFPMSLNNLNINIKYRDIYPNYIGLYSYKCLYFGILRIHNIFDLNPYQPEVGGLYASKSATVPTGFFDFYYDFGFLCIIPIFIAILIYVLLKRIVLRKTSSVGTYAIYFYWVPLWSFMSFQNTIYGSLVLIVTMILYFIINYLFRIEYINASESNISKENNDVNSNHNKHITN